MIEHLKEKLLKRLRIYGEFKKKSKGEEIEEGEELFSKRGSFIFGENVDKEYSVYFYELNLEMIKYWASDNFNNQVNKFS